MTTTFSGQTLLKTYLFGSLALHRNEQKHTYALSVNWRRMALVAGVGLVICYALLLSAGYLWLREVRKVDEIGFMDLAFFRVKRIRREMAAQQFVKAEAALVARDYSLAFIEMNSGLHNDPDNVAGRIETAAFLQMAGATDRALGLLEDGLARTPDSQPLIEATLKLLTTTQRDGEALKLLRGQLAPQFAGPNGTRLRTYEVLASLNAEGPAAAAKLLDSYPDLRKTPKSLPVVAAVLWANKDQRAAIETLVDFVKAEPDNFGGYADLAGYEQAAGYIADARQTADIACARFPMEIGAHILRIAVLEPLNPSELLRWEKEIGSYIKDFGDKTEAIDMLASLSGRKGWVDLARLLYEVGAARQDDFRSLAMYYSDALMFQHKYSEAQRVLAEIDRQTPEDGNLSVALWLREIMAASANGDHDAARENARRVASALRRNPTKLDLLRQRFIKLGIPEAVEELTLSPTAAKPASTGATTAPALQGAASSASVSVPSTTIPDKD
jgi:tetratricopeptide (TPR) repeat protein